MATLLNARSVLFNAATSRVTAGSVAIAATDTSLSITPGATTTDPASITLTAIPINYSSPAYQWSINIGGTGFTDIGGATSNSLTITGNAAYITSICTASQVQYRVTVTQSMVNTSTGVFNIPIVKLGGSIPVLAYRLISSVSLPSSPSTGSGFNGVGNPPYSGSPVTDDGFWHALPPAVIGTNLWCFQVAGTRDAADAYSWQNASYLSMLRVGKLEALAVNTGALTVDTTGHIKGGQTDYNTGTGFYLGYSSAAYKFSIGRPHQPLDSVNISTDTFTLVSHGFSNGSVVVFVNIGTVLDIDILTTYYARDVTADTFKLSVTNGGSVLNITGTSTTPPALFRASLLWNGSTFALNASGLLSISGSTYAGWFIPTGSLPTVVIDGNSLQQHALQVQGGSSFYEEVYVHESMRIDGACKFNESAYFNNGWEYKAFGISNYSPNYKYAYNDYDYIGIIGTSTTSVDMSGASGSTSFNCSNTSELFVDQIIRISYTTNKDSYMVGTVTAIVTNTSVTVNITYATQGGTYNAWTFTEAPIDRNLIKIAGRRPIHIGGEASSTIKSNKRNCVVASTTNTVVLTALPTPLIIDGYTLPTRTTGNYYLENTTENIRILLKNQTTASENGIYYYADNGGTYMLTRASDMNSTAELTDALVYIAEGVLNKGKMFICTGGGIDAPSAITFTQYFGEEELFTTVSIDIKPTGGTALKVYDDIIGTEPIIDLDGARTSAMLRINSTHTSAEFTGPGDVVPVVSINGGSGLALNVLGLSVFDDIEIATGGLKFPASFTDSADVNTLDDYEESTWTSTVTGTGTGISVVSSTAQYTKIGRNVSFTIALTTSAIGTAGDLTFTLPTSTSTNANFTFSVFAVGLGGAGALGGPVICWVDGATNVATVSYLNLANGLRGGDLATHTQATGTDIRISGTYW